MKKILIPALLSIFFLAGCFSGGPNGNDGGSTSTDDTTDDGSAPTLEAVADQSTLEDTTKTVTLLGDDPGGSELTYSATSSEANVIVTVSTASITLTPEANWSGLTIITANVSNGSETTSITFQLTVEPVNDAPVVNSITNKNTDESTATTVTLGGSDVEGSALTYTATSSSTNVTPSISGTTLTLTPANSWYGTSTISVKVNDGTVDSAAETFILTVNDADNTIPLLLVRLQFNTAPFDSFQSDEATWADKIFGINDGQLNHWLAEVSQDTSQFIPVLENSGTADNGIVTASIGVAHPGNNAFTANDQAVIKAAINAIDGNVNFAAYDDDSNGAIDRTEMQIMFIVAGGETATRHPDAGSVWAHKWSINTDPPTHDGVSLMNGNFGGTYSCFGERQGGAARTHDATIGVIAHELGHAAFNLPDLYDYDPSSAGIGSFGIMGGGSWGMKPGDTMSGETPSHMTALSKVKSGFVTPTVITADGVYTANDINSASFNIFQIESGTSGEYFLLQNRNAVGYDLALNRLDGTGTYAGGLMITHNSENVSGNSDDTHRRVDIEEANEPQNDAGGRGHYKGLFFSGNSTVFDDTTTPNSKRVDGNASNVSISSIDIQGASISFIVDVP